MATAGERRTVLVVDDEPAIRYLCRVNLELDGHRVLEAAGSTEARVHLAAEPVDVVFLDLQLAGERGEPLLDELRGHVPVAVVSGTAGEDAGADAVLTKPFAPAELAETVRRLSPTIVER